MERRLKDLYKVTSPIAGRPITEEGGSAATSPRTPTGSGQAFCLIKVPTWVRFTLVSAGVFCLNKSQLWRWKFYKLSYSYYYSKNIFFLVIFFKSQKISTTNQTLILILLLSPLRTRVLGSFPLWLPPTIQQLSREQIILPPPLLEYILLLSRLWQE